MTETPRRRPWKVLAVATLCLAGVPAGYVLLRESAGESLAQNLTQKSDDAKDKLAPTFVGWTKPDVAIVLSGQMHGYIQPCGCSDPQKGGLTRRFNFMQTLRDRGWPVTAVDLGDIAPPAGPQQLVKYVTSMKALKVMGYQAMGIGKSEFLMPLQEALGNYSANVAQPRLVAANLAQTKADGLFHLLNVRQNETFKAGGLKVGVICAISPLTATEIKKGLAPTEKDINFFDQKAALPAALKTLADAKVDLTVMLYQGLERDKRGAAEAKECARMLHQAHLANKAIAPVQIMLCLTDEEEPPSFPTKDAGAPNTSIITIGHKGRYIGVVGAWKHGAKIDLKYQLVSIGPEFAKGTGKPNPVADLMEQYAKEVRDGNYLARFPRANHEVQATLPKASYVGTEICAGCHQAAEQVWLTTRHAHAFETLVKATGPSLRQFDGECIACHTVGFKHHTGYYDPAPGATAQRIEKHNLRLRNVGCESCHGPGSEHANDPNNAKLYSLLNPHRPKDEEVNPNTPADVKNQLTNKRMLRMDYNLCQQCHDTENDVNWGNVPFEQKWRLIAHPNPKNNLNAAHAK